MMPLSIFSPDDAAATPPATPFRRRRRCHFFDGDAAIFELSFATTLLSIIAVSFALPPP
jgi:hypothetical protein